MVRLRFPSAAPPIAVRSLARWAGDTAATATAIAATAGHRPPADHDDADLEATGDPDGERVRWARS
jgi:hypothetical protein